MRGSAHARDSRHGRRETLRAGSLKRSWPSEGAGGRRGRRASLTPQIWYLGVVRGARTHIVRSVVPPIEMKLRLLRAQIADVPVSISELSQATESDEVLDSAIGACLSRRQRITAQR